MATNWPASHLLYLISPQFEAVDIIPTSKWFHSD